jgi:murein DD-endopeptidase MepM/ murein hydrolase activator NlpD
VSYSQSVRNAGVKFSFPAKKLSSDLLSVVFPVLLVVSLSPIRIAANPRPAAKSSPSAWKSCGPGVRLRLSVPVVTQGSLLLVELHSAKPLENLRADWGGQEVEFWRPDPRFENRRAVLGVDLERPEGEYELTLHSNVAGAPVSCTAAVTVHAGRFPTENLQVAPKFVEPGPEELKRAQEERDRLRVIFATLTPEKLWQGPFRVPLDGVAAGGNFGRRRVLNGQPGSPHTGVDFPAVIGTPVHAAQRGRVVLAEELFFSGNTVVVDHGLGLYTFYGHLSSIAVKVNDAVESGALLGEVGATGRVTGPHLHWGLTVNRARVNPLGIVALFAHETPPPDRH